MRRFVLSTFWLNCTVLIYSSGFRLPTASNRMCASKKKKRNQKTHTHTHVRKNIWAALQVTPIFKSKHLHWLLKALSKWHAITSVCEWREVNFPASYETLWLLGRTWLTEMQGLFTSYGQRRDQTHHSVFHLLTSGRNCSYEIVVFAYLNLSWDSNTMTFCHCVTQRKSSRVNSVNSLQGRRAKNPFTLYKFSQKACNF